MSELTEYGELFGLKHARKVVEKLIDSENNPHAILLYGSPGSGSKQIANMLIEHWLAPGDPESRAVTAYRRGNSADVLWIHPQKSGNQITIGQIRTHNTSTETPLVEFFRTQPLTAKHKVVVLNEADRLNNDASNALLKPLEEPAPHAKIILITSAISAIMPTILSRCLAIACDLPNRAELSTLEKWQLDLSAGAPEVLRAIHASPSAYLDLVKFFQELPKVSRLAALRASEQFQDLADGVQAAEQLTPRLANARILELSATFLNQNDLFPPSAPQLFIDAHRRTLGNGSFDRICDALFTQLLANNLVR